jgi:pyruvate formate lyase activating enzyme
MRNLFRPSFTCAHCGQTIPGVGESLGVCPDCLRADPEAGREHLERLHAGSRARYGLQVAAPHTENGLRCSLCFHRCSMNETDRGYCNVRSGARESLRTDGRRTARVSYYHDPLPTNCVADWVCAGGTGAGYPEFSCERGPEVGCYNLAVFFEACNFNCLYCQNWSFKSRLASGDPVMSSERLALAANGRTSCICYFGGDPGPQLPFALRVSELARQRRDQPILRICWETNGSMHPAWLKRMVGLSLPSGGCIKVDIKAWNPAIHRALTGFDNRAVLDNFARLAKWSRERPQPPLLIASTLLVPGYVGEEEVSQIAAFIARFNPDIPYALLGFAPQFYMKDFPTTSLDQARACREAATRAGLRRVRIGNRHLLR